eukprot:COSAG06_NODE_2215_length_7325_cov_5.038887_3_plen_88_part_00
MIGWVSTNCAFSVYQIMPIMLAAAAVAPESGHRATSSSSKGLGAHRPFAKVESPITYEQRQERKVSYSSFLLQSGMCLGKLKVNTCN